MSDLIKRSDAVVAIANLHVSHDREEIFKAYAENPHSMTTDFEGTLIDAINAVEAIPSADRPQLAKDIVEPISNGNVIMSEDTYEDLLDRPQGRYIDADALVTVCLYDDEHEERYTERMSIGKCLDLLTEEGCPKTADRPQGEWKSVKASIYPYGYDVECSVCGHRMGSSFGYKFCPMCGAKMKGADDD